MPVINWYYWMILGVVLVVFEIFTPGFFIAVIGFAAILTGILALFVQSFIVQVVFFGICVTLFLIFLRPVLIKVMYKSSDAKPSNADAMVGRHLTVTETIDNKRGVGYVKYYADSMPARSENGDEIAAGEEVVVTRMDGIKAIVKKA